MQKNKTQVFKALIAFLIIFGILSLYQTYITRGQVAYNFGIQMSSSLRSIARFVWFKKYLIGGVIGLFYISSALLALKRKKIVSFIMVIAATQLVLFGILLSIDYYSWALLIMPLLIFSAVFYFKKGVKT
ncbi:MAG: hypothetical protein ABH848_04395 [Candidatus Omnitrophota bacterium]